jgi:N-methylhydantoinase B
MAYAMASLVGGRQWRSGDMLVVNDPYLGGTHLPDVTLVSPLFIDNTLVAFVCNRAHHANIGAVTPGSMPISSSLDEEGVLIAPTLLIAAGKVVEPVENMLRQIDGEGHLFGDFSAQISANKVGVERLSQLVSTMGIPAFQVGIEAINAYGDRLARNRLETIPVGDYHFSDLMDDDGCGNRDLRISVNLRVSNGGIEVDFTGTSDQVKGNINCPLSVAAAAVYYAFRCLLPDQTPACEGTFRSIDLIAPEGCLVNAKRPAAVAAGNVETSMRIVDAVLGALAQVLPDAIPAASQGTMNNVAMGSRLARWDYYETIAGGMGASAARRGLSAVQSHMTNTLNTPIESLETHYPLRLRRYALRRGSGGSGRQVGGDGLIREFEFLAPTEVTLLTERRVHPPWGLAGGGNGQCGENRLNGQLLAGKCYFHAVPGDRLEIATPGGGGWGRPENLPDSSG